MEFSDNEQLWPSLSYFCVPSTEKGVAKTSSSWSQCQFTYLSLPIDCDVLEDGITLVFLEEQNAGHILDAQQIFIEWLVCYTCVNYFALTHICILKTSIRWSGQAVFCFQRIFLNLVFMTKLVAFPKGRILISDHEKAQGTGFLLLIPLVCPWNLLALPSNERRLWWHQ